MPPQKTHDEVVDMTKQYGAQGPAAGVFQYVHHEEEKPLFDLTQWFIDAGFAKDRVEAQRNLTIIAAVTISLSVLFFWLGQNGSVPPNVDRPAIDSYARIGPRS